MQFNAYACSTAGGPLIPFSYEAQKLDPFDIQVRISHCGICHSDLHLINNDWRITKYPLVPGHEIVGEIEEVGAFVKHLAPGNRVGVGWQRSACMTCVTCMGGEHNLCSRTSATCVGHFGGFADRVQIDSRFAFKIPESLDSAACAPLLCGGITVFSPLLRFDVKPIHRVGVIGIGGLGHLAIQFARAFGCEVFAFTSTQAKAEEALRLGAHHVVNSGVKKEIAAVSGKLDFLISTANADMEWSLFLRTLGNNGRLCFVGIPPSNLSTSLDNLLGQRKSISGSPIGSPHEIMRMLEFSSRHNIQAQIESFPMTEVNGALTRLKENKARYRLVLHN